MLSGVPREREPVKRRSSPMQFDEGLLATVPLEGQ